ncbi:MAG: gliding motility-associated ABC transporter substrate-binding protein GldG [Flavobacteriaceae bacterium]|nr:gliding motility-associated ABC transporter substrate-binding protein GldG [Flavobacteriaceae bacterium]
MQYFTIFTKEFREQLSGFSTTLVLVGYLLFTAFIFWWYESSAHLLHSGFADLTPYFTYAPWLLCLLVSALGMRSFSDEMKNKTWDLLLIYPVGIFQIVVNKFLLVWVLSLMALLPTLFYALPLQWLAVNPQDIDFNAIAVGFVGLVLLSGVFSGIAVFTSSLSKNALLAFFAALLLCLFFYVGLDTLGNVFFNSDNLLSRLSLRFQMLDFTKGVLNLGSVFYCLALTLFFLYLTRFKLQHRVSYQKGLLLRNLLIFSSVLIIALVFSLSYGKRIDFTKDQKFTLSEETLQLIGRIDKPVNIDIFLAGNLPSEYQKLQYEVRNLLDEFKAQNRLVSYTFIDPLEDETLAEDVVKQLVNFGLQPIRVSSREKGQIKQSLVFPWGVATIDNKNVINIPLLTEKTHPDTAVLVASSVQQLEYYFYTKLRLLFEADFHSLAVLKGNGENEDRLLSDGLASLRDFYQLAPFTLDSVAGNPVKTLAQLSTYDLLWISGPKIAFSEAEKLVLDQYLMQGGKVFWNLDFTAFSMDSLYQSGQSIALPVDLNLNDLFFKYGLRIEPRLVQDKFAAPLMLASGDAKNQQFNAVPWLLAPMILPDQQNSITKGVETVKMNFVNPIDTLPNAIQKTILLKSSDISKTTGLPLMIDLNETANAFEGFEAVGGGFPVAVLLEGAFTSAYKNRVLPVDLPNYKSDGKDSKMVVVSDDEVFNSQLDKGRPLPLGFDKWTGNRYGNKDFLLNALNYLSGDLTFIKLRNKQFKMSFLDTQAISSDASRYRLYVLIFPILLPLGISLICWGYRKAKFS